MATQFKDPITIDGYRKHHAYWKNITLTSKDYLIMDQKLEDLFFDFGHKIDMRTPQTRKPLMDALGRIADILFPRDPPRKMKRAVLVKTLFYIFRLCAPVWKAGYRMNGIRIDPDQLDRLDESLGLPIRRSRPLERPKVLKRKRDLTPQPRFVPVKRPARQISRGVNNESSRTWNPSITVVKASAPEEQFVTQLGSIMKGRTRLGTRSLQSRWIDLESLHFQNFRDGLRQCGWLEAGQEIWWSPESAAGDVTSVQFQVKIASDEELRAALWDSLTTRFPEFGGPRPAGVPSEPSGPEPSFTIIIKEAAEGQSKRKS
ncbi:hypothetical protein N7492_005853 [Penicillium capsulatum]|uniref:Uncharacterized protein n=1 Tax=Penicillium capsulatum TaxID=69766 RepID=A0A9W9LSB9_9EURO|nr:hypothetical protein N7492_005853 [Penicillium capsulatum]KAJ6135047.1 hypothetical protein N7512_000207 [Penicillium capsulatum]